MRSKFMRRFIAVIATACLGVGGALVVSTPAFASTFTVSDTGDGAGTVGTLRWAMTQAEANPGPDTIEFSITGSIPAGATPLPAITQPLTITGPGSAQMTVNALGDAFSSSLANDLAISGLTIDAVGKAVNKSSGSLSLTDVVAGGSGDSGISFTGTATGENVTLTDVTVDGGTAVGIDLSLSGGLANLSNVTVKNRSNSGVVFEPGTVATITANNVTTSSNVGVGFELDLDGGSASLTNISSNGNDAEGIVIDTIGSATVTASNLTVSTNQTDGFYLSAVDASTITVNDSNSTANQGVGFYIDAIAPGSTINLNRDSATQNLDGGLSALPFSSTGIEGTLTIESCQFNSNPVSGAVGPVAIGASGSGSVSINNTTMSNNTVSSGLTSGALVFVLDTAAISIANTTISGNSGSLVSGLAILIAADTGISDRGTLILQNSTIANNSAMSGSFTVSDVGDTAPTATEISILNSTIANNVSLGDPANSTPGTTTAGFENVVGLISNSIFSGGNAGDVLDLGGSTLTFNYSLIQDPDPSVTAAISAGTGNLTGINPMLGALANNGGPTLTMLPADNSPVIGAGDPAFSGPPTTDQRGQPRVIDGLDIGAVEVGPELAATGVQSLLPLPVGGALILIGLGAVIAVRRMKRA
ncbi:MAG: right-handed parallel beta-helix repeat-containing protein [Cryobacterium sp.]|nr:right-handed parallel beta-helix repeat-containing protein [Cryobacterium sp.]MBX3104885.1 right-handed parallel beta-helix repeat-containing protein [Cryobacterium sp.]